MRNPFNYRFGLPSPFYDNETGSFSPAALFALAEPGVWYDPSDVANLAWRRNLLVQTEAFDSASWGKFNSPITANAANAPDGTLTADLVQAAAGASALFQSVAMSTGISYTFSVWAKGAVGGEQFRFSFKDSTEVSPYQTLTTEWQRYSWTGTTAFASDSRAIRDFTSGSQIYIWGAQLELGSTATDYQRITDVNTEVIERFPTATLYQDVAGTIPVTTPGQAVALMLDKSRGLTLGTELVTNGTFDANTTGWVGNNANATLTYQGGGTALFQNVADFAYVKSAAVIALPAGAYRVSFDVLARSHPSAVFHVGLGSSGNTIYGPGSYSYVYFSNGTAQDFQIRPNSAGVGTLLIDNISVRELAGNHATQATAASRPFYGVVPQGGRRNLLTFTEQFDNAVWTKTDATIAASAVPSPSGSLTAQKLVETATTARHFVVTSTALVLATTLQTFTIYAQSAGRTRFNVIFSGSGNGDWAWFDLASGTATVGAGTNNGLTCSMVSVGSGWWRCIVTLTIAAASTMNLSLLDDATPVRLPTYTGDGTSGIFIWGAQLELGSTATPYQRVTTIYDVTEAGVPSCSYLFFDGGSDSMATGSIDFTATDKMTVWAGVRKNSSALSVLAELSVDADVNNGTFHAYSETNLYAFRSRGTGTSQASYTNASVAPPFSSVFTGIGDISGDIAELRLNGTQVATSASNQGTGNFGSYPLYIGARAGTGRFLNGEVFGLIVRGAASTTAQITATEAWLAPKTTFFSPVITGVPTVGVS